MPVIDTDGHVVETEHTWEFMDPSDAQYRPYGTEKSPSGRPREQWVIDGRMVRGVRNPIAAREQEKLYESTGRMVTTPQGAVDMEDVGARLRHMDELGIDTRGSGCSSRFSTRLCPPDPASCLPTVPTTRQCSRWKERSESKTRVRSSWLWEEEPSSATARRSLAIAAEEDYASASDRAGGLDEPQPARCSRWRRCGHR